MGYLYLYDNYNYSTLQVPLDYAPLHSTDTWEVNKPAVPEPSIRAAFFCACLLVYLFYRCYWKCIFYILLGSYKLQRYGSCGAYGAIARAAATYLFPKGLRGFLVCLYYIIES